jgi:HK97 family phage major capsid protein
MDNIEKLQQRNGELIAEVSALLGLEGLTADQEKRIDAAHDEIEANDKRIERLKKQTEIEARAAEKQDTAAGGKEEPNEGAGEKRNIELGEDNRAKEPWPTLGHQLQAVYRASMQPHNVDPRLIEERAATGLSESVPADGGFLVQKDFASEILRKAHDQANFKSRARRMPISGNANGTKINAIDEQSRANGSRWGGVQVYWVDEAAAKTASKPKFRQMELTLSKVAGLVYATDENLADAAQLEAIVREALPEEINHEVDETFVTGDGAGKPQGILNSACLVTVAKESGQTAATFLSENVFKMYARMWARSMSNAVWYINQDVWPQIFELKQVVGTGGVPMFIPGGGINAPPFGTLMGRPIQPVEQCETLGTVGDVILADWSQYMYADKGGIESASSIHVRFVNDETVFRFIYRIDGQPIWNSALTPKKGSNTQSPFVVLATRS